MARSELAAKCRHRGVNAGLDTVLKSMDAAKGAKALLPLKTAGVADQAKRVMAVTMVHRTGVDAASEGVLRIADIFGR